MAPPLRLPLLQIDAFTRDAFGGNPAAVVVLDGPRDTAWLQAVAGEMNLSETAFLMRRGSRRRSK
jgi:PhzF family phenazine biosynthesis protein